MKPSRGYHPFDSHHQSTQGSQYPRDNIGRVIAPACSEELVRRRIVQKKLSFRFHEWRDLLTGKALRPFRDDRLPYPTTRFILFRHHAASLTCASDSQGPGVDVADS